MIVVDPVRLSNFHQWQLSRNVLGEDPSNLEDARSWLRSIGANPDKPWEWGLTVPGGTPEPPPDLPVPRFEYHISTWPLTIRGRFLRQPKGVVVHGSRSGNPNRTLLQEYQGTCSHLKAGTPTGAGRQYYGWNATIGPGVIGFHMLTTQYGLNAGQDVMDDYLALEVAQPTLQTLMPDLMVETLAYWWENFARVGWPDLPPLFIPHGSTPQGIADGKSDLFPPNSPEWREFLNRLLLRLDI